VVLPKVIAPICVSPIAGKGPSLRGGKLSLVDRMGYPLPTNGWNPTQRSRMASLRGTFHGALTEDGPRAWLGDQPRLTLWPQDIRIRFDPTELIGPEDEVLASEGEDLHFAGGVVSLREGSPYGRPGERVISIESPLRGVPRHPPHPRLAQPLGRDEVIEAWGEARCRDSQYAESAEDSLNRPGFPGGSKPWEGWSHGEEGHIEAVPA